MSALERVRALYEQYLATTERLERDRRPGDGLFGFGKSPKDDPCHDQFAVALEALLGEILAGEPDSGETREVLEYIYRAPQVYPEPQTAYWMFQAVHGLTVPLAARLTPADAQAVRDEYVKTYRRWERMPSHKRALAALDRARKG